MADEKKTVRENAEGKKTNKFVAFFKNLPQNIATPFKNMWHELKKVTWPTRQDLIKYACIVLLFMVFMGVVIGLLDMGASRLVTAVSSLKSADETVISDDAAGLVNEAEDAAQELVSEVEEGAEGTVPATEETAEGAGQKAAPEETQAPADGK